MRGIPTEIELQRMAGDTLLPTTLQAIYTAILAGNAVTAAISTSGHTGPGIERLFIDLQGQGLNVVNSGSTFTVNW
jgi:hypothetical protein